MIVKIRHDCGIYYTYVYVNIGLKVKHSQSCYPAGCHCKYMLHRSRVGPVLYYTHVPASLDLVPRSIAWMHYDVTQALAELECSAAIPTLVDCCEIFHDIHPAMESE